MHSIASSSECQQILDSKPQVMLKFTAEWCGPCKAAAPIIEKMAPQFPDVFMAEVDIDKSQELASMYSVTAVPSFVFFHNKIEVDRVKGADIAKVTAALRSLAARTPSFGKGHRIDSAATAASKPPPTAAEIRAARTRALEKKRLEASTEKKKTEQTTDSIPTHSDLLRAKRSAGSTAAVGKSLDFVHSFFQYLVLYLLTLFSFDVRSRAMSLKQKKE